MKVLKALLIGENPPRVTHQALTVYLRRLLSDKTNELSECFGVLIMYSVTCPEFVNSYENFRNVMVIYPIHLSVNYHALKFHMKSNGKRIRDFRFPAE